MKLPPWLVIESYPDGVFLRDARTGWSTAGDDLRDALSDWRENAPTV